MGSGGGFDPNGGGGGGGGGRDGPYGLNVGFECTRAVSELLQLPLNSIIGAEGAVESLAAPMGECKERERWLSESNSSKDNSQTDAEVRPHRHLRNISGR